MIICVINEGAEPRKRQVSCPSHTAAQVVSCATLVQGWAPVLHTVQSSAGEEEEAQVQDSITRLWSQARTTFSQGPFPYLDNEAMLGPPAAPPALACLQGTQNFWNNFQIQKPV